MAAGNVGMNNIALGGFVHCRHELACRVFGCFGIVSRLGCPEAFDKSLQLGTHCLVPDSELLGLADGFDS